MMTTQPGAVRAYLDELTRLLGDAPDRDLVVDGVTRHIEEALADGPADPARVQAVLDELGDPAVIAADAAPAQQAAPAPFLERRGGAVLTVLLLAVGGYVVPFLGWVVGLGMLWTSKGWTLRDKLVGTLTPFVLVALAIGVELALQGGTHLAVLLALAISTIAVPVYLLPRFRARG